MIELGFEIGVIAAPSAHQTIGAPFAIRLFVEQSEAVLAQ
jgi:hypothetical protein